MPAWAKPFLFAGLCILLNDIALAADKADWATQIQPFLQTYCYDCHADDAKEGGLDLQSLSQDLNDAAAFSVWERIFDRVANREMPPANVGSVPETERGEFMQPLDDVLSQAHAASKGTLLRRLNRREYENTMNDLFGTHLDLADLLPEDSRSQEFDNVGAALGLSMVHLERYMDAATLVMDTAIAKTTQAPVPVRITANYRDSREGEKFIGQRWKLLSDGAVVRFSGGGYPSGMLRGSAVSQPGRYRVRVTGYAYQSAEPVTFSVGGTSFLRGSEKPIYGFWSLPPGEPGTAHAIEFETWIESKFMLAIEPYGIQDPQRYQRKSIEDYEGPGLAIVEVTLEGPLSDSWPSRGHQLLFTGLDRREKPPANPQIKTKSWYTPEFEIICSEEAREISDVLVRVATKAFRRPAEAAQIEKFVALYQREREDEQSIEESLRTAVVAVLCSPRFLYFQEPPGRLDGYALADRLAYFLTRTMPDDELLALAESGELSDPATLRAETERLLSDAKFERFLADFCDNWLDLRDIDFTLPDSQMFPEYDDFLRYSMPQETRRFLRELIENNEPIVNLVDSQFAMLNSRLAEHYDLPTVEGAHLRRVSLPAGSWRGGLLSQASILKVTANGTNTSPVTRGAWVMERILGETPPPGVPGVEPDIRGAATLRELLAQHRNSVDCNACHQKIDPPGFALESFNPIGGFRTYYRSLGEGERVSKTVNGRKVAYRVGPSVDSSGLLPDLGSFTDFREFRQLLAGSPDKLATSFIEKILTFATGRSLGFSDREEIEQLVKQAEGSGFGMRDLIHLCVQSEIFQNK
ncbi:MAG: DUF1592 domain-containing protein [bacterium]|nr:DUF1592 domain-containing protein [bacterium]